MRFVNGDNNMPDIPLKVLEIQDSSELVIVCGAGISRKAGLPLFKELVDKVYEKLCLSPSPLMKTAKEHNQYDRALNLLIPIYGRENVNNAIVDLLGWPQDKDADMHKAILELSKVDSCYRLVTTNFDVGFKKALGTINGNYIHIAPALPVPKKDWKSIVHLHGMISEESPYDSELIYTSGDFGTAYLTEGWASRFFLEGWANYVRDGLASKDKASSFL